MKTAFYTFFSVFMIACTGSQSQPNKTMKDQTNPLLCDIETGMCEIPSEKNPGGNQTAAESLQKPVKVIYYTDPICSSCWGIEPQLRKLKLEYGDVLDFEYRMGGLLPDWSYNSGGISKPADVAHHWDEVSEYYDMPIDGDLWLEDPLNSSYPPSIAFKAAQIQSREKAVLFMRELRELVFLKKKNIAKWANIEEAANRVGLDTRQLKTDFDGKANELFREDLELAKQLGVRGFPSMFFVDDKGNTEFVYGSKAYAFFEVALLKLASGAKKKMYDKSWNALFSVYPSLTAREFAELSDTPRNESEKQLDKLVAEGKLFKVDTKNGSLWKLKK